MDDQPCDSDQQGAPANGARRDLRALIAAEFDKRPAPIKATTYLQTWQSHSKPVALMCEGGGKYVVKALQMNRVAEMGRVLVNDQIVARLGELIGASVPRVAFIDIPVELIANQAQMSHMMAGIAHGSQFVENVTEREGFLYAAIPENRPRFALLAVLFGWIGAQDHQFVYSKTAPQLVYSVDHGHFFPGGPVWTEQSLAAATHPQPDTQITNSCNATQEELHLALRALSAVPDEALISIVALPPDEWGLTMEDRITLFEFFTERRSELLAMLPVGN
jgi:hypothetical protein